MGAAADCSDGSLDESRDLSSSGRSAAAGCGDRRIDYSIERLGAGFERGANQQRDMERMAERRRSNLRECRAQSTGGISEPRSRLRLRRAELCDMAEFVDYSALLRYQEQQQEP
jgi:hypothetical protein